MLASNLRGIRIALVVALLALVTVLVAFLGSSPADERVGARRSAEAAKGKGAGADHEVEGGAPPAGTPRLHGLVRALEGPPIADALVCATPWTTPRGGGRWRWTPTLAGLLATVCGCSDRAGQFDLATGGGRFLVRASAIGWRPAIHEAPVIVALGLEPPAIELALEAGGRTVRGRVVDRFGGPIEGVLIATDDGAFALADDEGAFALTAVASSVVLVPWRPGYVSRGVLTPAPTSDLVVTMTPEAVIEGRVIDEAGQPVVGIDVRTGRRDSEERTTTDDRGAFRLTGLLPGVVQLRALDDEHDGSSTPLEVALGSTLVGVEIRVAPSEVAIWKIIDAATHEPCAGATVALHGPMREYSPELRGDEAGVVRLVDVPPGDYRATIRCPGHVAMNEEVLVDVGEDRRIALERGLTIAGVVHDADGEPVEGARVALRAVEDDGKRTGIAASTDRSGRFTLREAAPGASIVEATGSATVAAQPTTLALTLTGDRDDLELTLPAVGELRGRVVDDQDAPVGGVTVSLRATESFAAMGIGSGDDGSFVFHAPPGRYTVEASWRRGVPGPEEPHAGQPIEILDPRHPATVILRIEARPRYRARGRVVDRDGAPIADVAVSVPGAGIDALTDAAGRFTLEGLPGPQVNLSLDASDGARALHRDLEVTGDGDLELVLAGVVTVCGEVRGLDPTGTFKIGTYRFPADKPEFCAPGIPLGPQTLVAVQGVRSASASIDVVDPPPRVTFTLAASAGPIVGHVRDPEGVPASGHVWLRRADGQIIATTALDGGGGFSFASSPSGPVSLVFRWPWQTSGVDRWPRIDLDLEPGAARRDLEIVATGRLSAR